MIRIEIGDHDVPTSKYSVKQRSNTLGYLNEA